MSASLTIKLTIIIVVMYLIQIRIQRLGPGMVQQFQTRCNDCGGQGEKIRGTNLYM